MKIKIFLIVIGIIISFFWGQATCQKENWKKITENVKYVQKYERKIWAEPNSDKSQLLELMRKNEL